MDAQLEINFSTADAFRKVKDDGEILTGDLRADMLARMIREHTRQIETLRAKTLIFEVELCNLIGSHSGVQTTEGRITFKMGTAGDIDWRGVALELGADKHPIVVEKHRKPPVRRLTLPRTWKKVA